MVCGTTLNGAGGDLKLTGIKYMLRQNRLNSTSLPFATFALSIAILAQARAADFPYVAQISCTIGGHPIPVESCFYDPDGGTELEVQTTQSYKMYQHMEIPRAGKISPQGVLQINLTEKFRLAAQNASPTALLNIKILDAADGSTKFEKSARQFRVIAVQN
ncbi:hypothetical protein [Herbaspirillum huttiense]|uniref:hypothetical protein n=1 Tax=Herbaspirillum huttiense TaxID=863372 RepID=UPI0031CEF915